MRDVNDAIETEARRAELRAAEAEVLGAGDDETAMLREFGGTRDGAA